jgi:hypothetical protein
MRRGIIICTAKILDKAMTKGKKAMVIHPLDVAGTGLQVRP